MEVIAQRCGIDLIQRGETLSVEQFARVGDALAALEGATKEIP